MNTPVYSILIKVNHNKSPEKIQSQFNKVVPEILKRKGLNNTNCLITEDPIVGYDAVDFINHKMSILIRYKLINLKTNL